MSETGSWTFCDCGKCGLVWDTVADAVVANVILEDENGRWTPEKRDEHARLIAAAPELLAALRETDQLLREIYPSAGEDGYWPTVTPIVQRVRAAIAKPSAPRRRGPG